MPKSKWMGAALAAALLVGCGARESAPKYPYDVLRADDKDVLEVDIVGALSSNALESRVQGYSSIPLNIRVADIFAPIKGQPWNAEAVAALNALTKGKHARVRIYDSHRIGDSAWTTGRVFVGSQDISWELVAGGNAWVWEEKSKDQALKNLQAWAREHKKGLWALPEADREPPWRALDRKIRATINEREESKSN